MAMERKARERMSEQGEGGASARALPSPRGAIVGEVAS
jgi:hypothetical protein